MEYISNFGLTILLTLISAILFVFGLIAGTVIFLVLGVYYIYLYIIGFIDERKGRNGE